MPPHQRAIRRSRLYCGGVASRRRQPRVTIAYDDQSGFRDFMVGCYCPQHCVLRIRSGLTRERIDRRGRTDLDFVDHRWKLNPKPPETKSAQGPGICVSRWLRIRR
jgi:hypothetical protein